MKTTHLVIFFFCLFITTACDDDFSTAGIPEKYTIQFNQHGGMAPYGTTIYFSNQDSSYVNFVMDEVRNKITFLPTQKELEALVKNIRKQKFNKIKTREEVVMDRGGESIKIDFDGQKHRVSDMGISFIKGKWQANFTALEDHIIAIAKQNVSKQLIPIVIEIDESMKEENTIISIGSNDHSFINWSTSAGAQVLRSEYRTRLMEGPNQLFCHIFKTSKSGNKHLVNWNASVYFAKENTRIKLSRVDNDIVYEIN